MHDVKRHDLKEPGRFLILASLPGNRVDLALAAWRRGADGLKVHINVAHRASGLVFGSWSQEKQRIQAIRQAVSIPVGIMAGADSKRVREDLPHLEGQDLAFVDAYAHHLPAEAITRPPAPLMVALDQNFQPQEAGEYGAMPHVAWIEASVVPPDEYGQPLTLSDLARYRRIVEAAGCPVVVPSQKALLPADLQALEVL